MQYEYEHHWLIDKLELSYKGRITIQYVKE